MIEMKTDILKDKNQIFRVDSLVNRAKYQRRNVGIEISIKNI